MTATAVRSSNRQQLPLHHQAMYSPTAAISGFGGQPTSPRITPDSLISRSPSYGRNSPDELALTSLRSEKHTDDEFTSHNEGEEDDYDSYGDDSPPPAKRQQKDTTQITRYKNTIRYLDHQHHEDLTAHLWSAVLIKKHSHEERSPTAANKALFGKQQQNVEAVIPSSPIYVNVEPSVNADGNANDKATNNLGKKPPKKRPSRKSIITPIHPSWTSWPLPSPIVPRRPSQSVGSTYTNPLDKKLLRQYPSKDLHECLEALFLRQSTALLCGKGMGDTVTSDDDRPKALLRPLIGGIFQKLDRLLDSLHEEREHHVINHLAYTQKHERKFRVVRRGRRRVKGGIERPVYANTTIELDSDEKFEEAKRTSTTRKRKVKSKPESGDELEGTGCRPEERFLSRAAPQQPNDETPVILANTRAHLSKVRDWSVLLGLAQISGWDSPIVVRFPDTAVGRATDRMSRLLGQGMKFRTLDPEWSKQGGNKMYTFPLPEQEKGSGVLEMDQNGNGKQKKEDSDLLEPIIWRPRLPLENRTRKERMKR